MSRYRIPAAERRVETRHGNSRFIATVAPAPTMDEAKAVLRRIRAEMPDATHHVHALRIGHGASVTEGMSDDGEPSGTSGPPVLAILRGSGIGDIMLVVTRYFGGTKLGTGGLVTAYGDAARAVLEGLETIEKMDRTTVDLQFEYGHFERIRRLLASREAIVSGEAFGESVTLSAQVPTEILDAVRAELNDITAGRCVVMIPPA